MKGKYKILGWAMLFGLTACYDLDKTPEGELSTADPFNSVGEIRNYIDQFYESGVRTQGFDAGGGAYIAGYDTHSDNMASSSISTRLNGQTALSDASKLTGYTYVRNVNFLLENIGNCKDKGNPLFSQYWGEAYYFRAWYYYDMFVKYGPLTWVSIPLDPNLEEMQLPRDSRTVVTDSILADLDKAIGLLQEKSNSSTMRVHRDVARALKSEVALFEATWEKYHKAKSDKFYDPAVTDEKIKGYLTVAAKAAKDVMDRNVWHIHNTGDVNNDYREVFETTDLSSNSEVLWFKMYNGDPIGNNVDRYLNRGGGGVGVTASLVDDYLTIDGRPFVGQEKADAQAVFGKELQPTVRDPRLAQTVCTPGQHLRPDVTEGYVVPPLVSNSDAYHVNTTGYSLLKHVQIGYTGNLDAEYKGATPAIQFRYADVLLNYAEALAESDGAANAAEIVSALHPLRERAGMPDVDFDREYNTASDYPFASLDKYVQAVRRERRVEKACEGRRLDDILRWAAAEELLVGKWPKGVLFVGSNLEGHAQYGDRLKYDQPADNNLFLTGKPGDAMRYVLPCDPKGHENGMQFKVDRDYLLPIQQRMISLTGNKWTQNPGW